MKVLDRQGFRMYPKDDPSGIPVLATLTPTLGDSTQLDQSKIALIDLLTTRITRMFVPYDLDDSSMTK